LKRVSDVRIVSGAQEKQRVTPRRSGLAHQPVASLHGHHRGHRGRPPRGPVPAVEEAATKAARGRVIGVAVGASPHPAPPPPSSEESPCPQASSSTPTAAPKSYRTPRR